MAGNFKPQNADREVLSYSIKSMTPRNGVSQNGAGLFDGKAADAWNQNTVVDFMSPATITLEISEPCRIWRVGTNNWSGSINPLTVSCLSNNFYTATNYTLTAVKENWDTTWQVFTTLPMGGTWKFTGGSSRIDSEWYIEYYPESTSKWVNSLSASKFIEYVDGISDEDMLGNVLTILTNATIVEELKIQRSRIYNRWNKIHNPVKYFSQANVAYLLSELTERIKRAHINE